MSRDAPEVAAVAAREVGFARAAPFTGDDTIPAEADGCRDNRRRTGMSARVSGAGYLGISQANRLTVEMHCTYTGASMLTRMATATITMGTRMITGPGVGGVRAQA